MGLVFTSNFSTYRDKTPLVIKPGNFGEIILPGSFFCFHLHLFVY